MKRKLRSILAPGTPQWVGRRAQWKALGISDEDMEKPKIAIVNSSSDTFSRPLLIRMCASNAWRSRVNSCRISIFTSAQSDFCSWAKAGTTQPNSPAQSRTMPF